MMPPKFAAGFRACFVALTLGAAATMPAAEPKQPSLVGATREEVLQRLGEPRSNIMAGAREVLLFERDRVVLRNNIVVEVERLPAEPPRRPPPVVPAEPPADTAVPGAENDATAAETPPMATRTQAAPEVADVPVTPPPPDPDAPLAIRSVRPRGTAAPAGPGPGVIPPPTVAVAPVPATKNTEKAEARRISPPAPVAPVTAPVTLEPIAAASAVSGAAETAPEAKAEEAEPKEETPTSAKAKSAPRHRTTEADLAGADEGVFTAQTYIIAFVTIVGGVGYLFWRQRQRQLELVATAVSRTPFPVSSTNGGGVRFSAEQLARLEWKRFEELIASYYSKTGVVAVRTKTGPSSPVHIKISWKGEPRPFACVQCLSHPVGLIDAKPLHDLVATLAAEDIRRGYVVTTGKFGVPARDLAEEKHLTLLSGDILIEKLNALPDAARSELMQEMTAGDPTTPSCPKCETKMLRSPEDPSTYRCAAHPEQTMTRG